MFWVAGRPERNRLFVRSENVLFELLSEGRARALWPAGRNLEGCREKYTSVKFTRGCGPVGRLRSAVRASRKRVVRRKGGHHKGDRNGVALDEPPFFPEGRR